MMMTNSIAEELKETTPVEAPLEDSDMDDLSVSDHYDSEKFCRYVDAASYLLHDSFSNKAKNVSTKRLELKEFLALHQNMVDGVFDVIKDKTLAYLDQIVLVFLHRSLMNLKLECKTTQLHLRKLLGIPEFKDSILSTPPVVDP